MREELDTTLEVFRKEGKLLEAQRLAARTRHDLELMKETGFCPGIKNYQSGTGRSKTGGAAVHAVRLLSGRLFDLCG